ncbi:MAG: hypothetical protein DDT34_01735 [Firmicutes bacterium]|nr:hypothetical protein [Bacillota bacterium]MBT9158186.1 hypothetical protein [Bacillota bacterium]
MREWLSLLFTNLDLQRQAMIRDDLEAISMLVEEQSAILKTVEQESPFGVPLTGSEDEKLRAIMDMVEGNQLLAQQSLHFARRVLAALGDAKIYGQSLDRRA